MILDQFGREYPALKQPDKHPLAAAPILDTWREYVAAGLTPERLATIFKEADAGDVSRQSQLFEQMEEKDGHLMGEIGKRRNAVLDIEFAVRPASEDSRDVKVAEFVQEFLDNMTDFDDVMVSLQDGVGKGFSGLEIHWDVSAGQALPMDLEFIEQKRFLFMDPAGYLRKTPLLLTDEHTMGMEIPPWKMVLHRYGGKSGHPTRSGLLRVCSWWFMFKNYSVKDWVVFCEVYGMPLRVGKYDAGASKEDKDALVTAISSLGSDAAGIISKATEIEFIQGSKGSVSADLYENLANFGNKEISKAILGQTLTAEVGDKGSYAASQTHNEVRLDLAKADTKACAATARYQLIRPIVGFNFGWDTPIPKYEPVWEEEEDLKAKSDWVAALLDRGVRMPVSFVNKEFNIPDPQKGEETVGGSPAPATDAPVSAKRIAAKAAPSADESPAESLDALGRKVMDAVDLSTLVDPVKEMLQKAETLEDFRDRMLSAFSGMAPTALGETMQQALTLADLSGRYDAQER